MNKTKTLFFSSKSLACGELHGILSRFIAVLYWDDWIFFSNYYSGISSAPVINRIDFSRSRTKTQCSSVLSLFCYKIVSALWWSLKKGSTYMNKKKSLVSTLNNLWLKHRILLQIGICYVRGRKYVEDVCYSASWAIVQFTFHSQKLCKELFI